MAMDNKIGYKSPGSYTMVEEVLPKCQHMCSLPGRNKGLLWRMRCW